MPALVPPAAKILIVEDNDADAYLLQKTLRASAGATQAEMTHASRLSDAFKLLDEQAFNVVLLDLSLPDSHGFNTFARLHAHSPQTPVILCTGQDDEALGLEAVRAGAQECVVKGTLNGKIFWRLILHAIERQGLEKAVRDSEQRFKRLLGSVTDYIYTVKIEDGRVVSTQHGPGCARVTGYESHEFDEDRHLWARMVLEEDRAMILEHAAEVRAHRPATLEHRIRHKSGAIRWVRHTPVLRVDEQGVLLGYDGLISDITERKEAEEALRKAVEDLQKSREELRAAQAQLIHAERMETVGRMAAGVAHEVKNPLGILLMSLDYLYQTLKDRGPVLNSVIDDMRQAALRADRIIHGLLDYSASDEIEGKFQDVNGLVSRALLLVKHGGTLNQVTTQAELAPGLPSLFLDGNKIEQVLVNLFSNSIDAMPKGGTLTVRTRQETLVQTQRDLGAREAANFYAGDPVVVVEIEDTGTGIPAEMLRKIFDPFFTTKATGKGTGLGLAIVKRIIELHNGSIELTNRPEGGVRCRLMFRILPVNEPARPKAQQPKPALV